MKCEHCKYDYGQDERGHICRLAGCEARLTDEQVEDCRFGVDENNGEPFDDNQGGISK